MANTKISFAQAMGELEEINQWFEDNELDLDEALVKYERASELISYCQERLKEAENKFIEINSKIQSEGEDI